ncbi:MAG TPA: hybrid sensor histidine kinase/response regulator, partial [Anaerolineae bacterium]|nr:hybrid sensor histidine kinase/response regulator [Anaerolineae bacterium]
MGQDFDLSPFLAEFTAEVQEHLQVLNEGFLALEQTPDDRELIHQLFRSAHTIKGSAKVMGFGRISQVAHALEDVLSALRDDQLRVSRRVCDVAFGALDAIGQLLSGELPKGEIEAVLADLRATLTSMPEIDTVSLAETVPEPTPPLGGTPRRSSTTIEEKSPEGTEESQQTTTTHPQPGTVTSLGEETVRISVSKLDRLLALVGELVAGRLRAQKQEQRTKALLALARSQQRTLAACLEEVGRANWGDGGTGLNQKLRTIAQHSEGIREALETLHQAADDHAQQLTSLSDELGDEVMRLRLLPVATLYALLPRVVRDQAHELGKEAALILEGEETELDRQVLQDLREPLQHLIRNAIDHGIEPPEEREKLGKPRIGQLHLSARQQGGQVVLTLSDDGRGIDVNQVRTTAVRRGLITAEQAAALDDNTTLELIYLPGLSTSKLVTATSGRGVGMEVVKTTISRLGGNVQVSSQPGRGTTFTISLPLTLTLAQVLLISVAKQTYAISTANVERVVRVDSRQVRHAGGKTAFHWSGQTIPLVRLSTVLGVNGSGEGEEGPSAYPVLLLRQQKSVIGFQVDELLDEQEVVVKPLQGLLAGAEHTVGATILGDGSVVAILDAANLARIARSGLVAEARPLLQEPEPSARPLILLVEDSITTRELERSILEASGYDVVAVSNGREAWEALAQNDISLVVTDIQMPVMDGFELCEKMRADDRYRDIPVVIVTSLEKTEDKRRGLEVGAQAYILKNAF